MILNTDIFSLMGSENVDSHSLLITLSIFNIQHSDYNVCGNII